MADNKWYEEIPSAAKDAGVSSLADRPNRPASYGEGRLTAAQLKARFDTLSRLLIDKLNEVIKGVTGKDFAEHVLADIEGYETLSDVFKAIESGAIVKDTLVDGKTIEAILSEIGDFEAPKAGFSSVPSPSAGAVYNDKGELIVSLRFNGEEKTGAAVPISVVAEIVESAVAANATSIRINADASTNKLSIDLLNANGEVVASSAEVELPLGQFVEAVLSDDGKNVIFTLANGSTVTIPTESIGGGGVNSDLEQTTGTRTDAAMSQDASTKAFVPKPASNSNAYRMLTYRGDTGVTSVQIYQTTPSANAIPQWTSKKTLKADDPIDDNDLATKRYADTIKAAVSGRLYDYVTDSDVYATKTPPANALSYAYLLHVGHVIIPTDATAEYADVEFIAALDANGNEVRRYEPTAPQLINIDGVSRIVFYPPASVAAGRDYFVESSIMYQVKVEV